jgi:C4-dicarboxylate transporter DctQ subunit
VGPKAPSVPVMNCPGYMTSFRGPLGHEVLIPKEERLPVQKLKKALSLLDRLMDSFAVVGAILIIYIMAATCLEVVARRVRYPQKWVMETTEYSLLFITFLATAWLLRGEYHVRMDILTNALNQRAQALLGVISSILGIIVSLVLVIFGSIVTWDYLQRGVFRPTPLLTPSAPLYAIIPLGSFFLLIQFVRRTGGYLKIWSTSRKNKERQKKAT